MTTFLAVTAYCLVGCNSGSPSGETLHVLECDTETGAAKIVQTVKGVTGTTYFQFDRGRNSVYSMIGEKRDGASVGSVVVFPVERAEGGVPRLGAMRRLAELPCEAPCHIAFSPDYLLVSTASYLGRTACVLAPTDPRSGAVRLPNEGVGPRADRQKQAYAHCTFYTPDGRFLGVVDLGCDRIHFYRVAELKEKRRFSLVSQLRAEPGDGPRHAIFSPDGKTLFVVNELSSTVASYRYEVRGGEPVFTRLSYLPMTPAGTDPASTKAAAIKLTADGKLLMASNRGLDSIAFFDVAADGSLAFRALAPLRGRFPRDFELMPGERFMVVGHKLSDEIQVYAFDRATCSLKAVGEAIPCWRPLCFKFF